MCFRVRCHSLSPVLVQLLSSRRLAESHQVHRGEDAHLAANLEVVGRLKKHVVDGGGALGRPPDKLEDGGGDVGEVREAARVGHGDVPRNLPVDEVDVDGVHHLEARRLGRLEDVVEVADAGEGVAFGDAGDDLVVLRVGRVVERRGEPLVRGEVSARLEHLEHLLVEVREVGRVARSLDAKGAVEGSRLEGHLEKVALHHRALLREARRLVVLRGAAHLVLVDGDTRHLGARVARHRAHGAANTAPDVERRLARANLDRVADARLVAVDARVERLALLPRRKVERLAPPVLVEVRESE
mmetsp:Transcript_14861/g.48705  ORF Transcript_14861/g.48705 Transcript_14861/m.48705 type:complete len:299 (-) Transcript_14861:5-901(-)